MAFENPNMDEIKEILQTKQRIAVVGLSDRPERTSYAVSKAMQQAGYEIIPVNPNIEESLGEKAVNSLLDIEGPVDIVDVFRRSQFLPELAEQTVEIGAAVFWAQQGVHNEEAADYLKEHGVTTIMDFCIKVAHSLTQS